MAKFPSNEGFYQAMKITSDAHGISKDTEELLKIREIEEGLKK